MAGQLEKIKESEMLVMGSFILALDGLCFLLDLTAVGAAIALPIQGLTSFAMLQWFKHKGSQAGTLGKQILKYVLGELPTGNFWVFIVSAIIHNNQNKLGALRKVEGAGAALKAAKGATGIVGKIRAAQGAYQEKVSQEPEELAA